MTVYDFDNTIYDGESGFDIFMFYLKKDPKEIAKFIPRFGEAFIRYKRGAINANEVIGEYGDLLTSYCNKIPDIDKDIIEFWDEHEKKIKSFYAKIQTPDDVIVSASKLIHNLYKKKLILNRKMLAQVAVSNPNNLYTISNKIKIIN